MNYIGAETSEMNDQIDGFSQKTLRSNKKSENII